MTWVRHHDGRSRSIKMLRLSDAAYRLDGEAMEWCSSTGTDGRIPADLIGSTPAKPLERRILLRLVAELVKAGRWHRAEESRCPHPTNQCAEPGPDGWVIHDYLEFNPSAAEVEADRVAKKERQDRWRKAKRNGKTGRFAGSDQHVDASRDGPGDSLETRLTTHYETGYETPPRPAPPRPEGGGERGAPRSGEPPPAVTGAAPAEVGSEDQLPPRRPPSATPEVRQAALAVARTAAETARRARRNALSDGEVWAALNPREDPAT